MSDIERFEEDFKTAAKKHGFIDLVFAIVLDEQGGIFQMSSKNEDNRGKYTAVMANIMMGRDDARGFILDSVKMYFYNLKLMDEDMARNVFMEWAAGVEPKGKSQKKTVH